MIARAHRRRPIIQITSLLDVFVILLFYFMIFTVFRTTPAGVDVVLPQAATATTVPRRDLTVTVDEAGNIYAQGQLTQPSNLAQLAADMLLQDPHLTVTIKADEATRYENVVTVIDTVRSVGAYQIRLAVNLPSSEGR
ncbi:MAG TPA: biopolymer transporter ExbD [Firmicutes bacterium]|jgi:biopolymer transport protein ExbD|nr:biopolymer transporter ExbD [Bacillota bacterium]